MPRDEYDTGAVLDTLGDVEPCQELEAMKGLLQDLTSPEALDASDWLAPLELTDGAVCLAVGGEEVAGFDMGTTYLSYAGGDLFAQLPHQFEFDRPATLPRGHAAAVIGAHVPHATPVHRDETPFADAPPALRYEVRCKDDDVVPDPFDGEAQSQHANHADARAQAVKLARAYDLDYGVYDTVNEEFVDGRQPRADGSDDLPGFPRAALERLIDEAEAAYAENIDEYGPGKNWHQEYAFDMLWEAIENIRDARDRHNPNEVDLGELRDALNYMLFAADISLSQDAVADGGDVLLPQHSLYDYNAVVHGADLHRDCLALTGAGKPCSYQAYANNDDPVCNTHAGVDDPTLVAGAHQWARISDAGSPTARETLAVCVACEEVWEGGTPALAVDCPTCGRSAGTRCQVDRESAGVSAPIPPHPERREQAREVLDDYTECPFGPGRIAGEGEFAVQQTGLDGGKPEGQATFGGDIQKPTGGDADDA